MVLALGVFLAATRAGVCSVDSMGLFLLICNLSGRWRANRGLNAELLCVLRVQPLPAAGLHRVATSDAADGSSAEKAIQNIETNVPARRTPRDEASIDVVPERQARAATKGFEFPPDIAVLKHLGSVGSRHRCYLRPARSHPGEIHQGSDRSQAPIDHKGRPLAYMRRIGKCQPDFFRRVAQLSDENERPLFAVLSYLRPAGGTRCVLLASGHLLLLVSFFGGVDRSMRSKWRLRTST